MARVFISYCHADKDVARNLHTLFAAAGVTPWQDEKCIRAGDDFAVEICRAIRDCDAFVLLLSSASNSSDYVSKEVAIAHHFHKTILPVFVEDVDVADALLPYVVRRHYWSLTKQAAHDLAVDLKERLDRAAASHSTTTPSAESGARESTTTVERGESGHLVTNGEYVPFLNDGEGRRPLGWGLDHPQSATGQENKPVTGVSWLDAVAYCDWVGGRLPRGSRRMPLANTDLRPDSRGLLEWRDGGTELHKQVCELDSPIVFTIMHRTSRSPKIGFRCIPLEERTAREWVHIDGGVLSLGSDIATLTRLASAYRLSLGVMRPILNRGSRRCDVDSYAIARTCVTNEEYYAFTRATGRAWPCHWDAKWLKRHERPFPPRLASMPVVNVSANQAQAYCSWSRIRLPSWAEWQRAAGGAAGHPYPWGQSYGAEFCNSVESERGSLAAVGEYPLGDSPDGVRQMCGNVAEWVLAPDGRYEVHGGSCRVPCEIWGIAYVFRQVDSDFQSPDSGFRVVCA